MSYKLSNGTSIIRQTDNATIPADSSNPDYRDYLDWVAAGGISLLADVPDPNIAINSAITAIEQSTMVPRVVREELLWVMADKAASLAALPGETRTTLQILAANIAYTRVKAVDDQIRALRARLV